jgi:NADP-reducing hydrogenase subunit HndB
MKTLEDLRKIRKKVQSDSSRNNSNFRYKVVVGMGTSGIATGARDVMKTILAEISNLGIKNIIVSQTGEKGLAALEPVIDVFEDGRPTITYVNLNPQKARQIVNQHLLNNKIVQEYTVSFRD